MYVVIFEVEPYESGKEKHLDLAARPRKTVKSRCFYFDKAVSNPKQSPENIVSVDLER